MIKKYLSKIGMIIVAIGFGILIIFPLSYWASNPELSQMQVFIATWKPNIIGVLVSIIGTLLYNR